MICKNKYKIQNKINEGSFGSVYKANNTITNEVVAIKFEKKSDTIKSLKNEAKIYQYLGKIEGFPIIKMFGTTDQYNYLVMNLLGNSLLNVINNYNKLSLKTVLVLGIQIIQRIKSLHEKCLLHRDIKPSNFLFGLEYESNKLFIIDFGFTKRYDYNGIHINKKNIRKTIGSTNYCSINVHNYIEPSRRDDLESVIYVILTMLVGKLKWFNNPNLSDILLLKEKLLFDNIPSFIKLMLNHIRNLNFDEKPDYNYLIDLMKKEFKDNDFNNSLDFEWS